MYYVLEGDPMEGRAGPYLKKPKLVFGRPWGTEGALTRAPSETRDHWGLLRVIGNIGASLSASQKPMI